MFRTILIPIGNDEEVETRIKSTVKIAQKFAAHIRALHVVPTLKSLEQLTPYAYYSYDLYTHIWDTQKAKACERKKYFLDYMSKHYEDSEWREEEGDFMRALKLSSRTCDLTVISQGEDTYSDIMGSMARFMMESSLPVLTVPENGLADNVGQNIMIAWDASAEAARAVHDSLPFLQMAREVTVVTIHESRKTANSTEDICAMLGRLGVNAKGVEEPESGDRAEQILDLARKWDVDLIVAGAWGHKRLAEVIFGGVTKTLYTNQEIAVFFAH